MRHTPAFASTGPGGRQRGTRLRARRWVARSALAALLMTPLLVAVLPSATATAAAALTRYPYLTDATQSSVTVNWATTRAAPTGTVTWGPAGSCTANTATATATPTTVNGVAQYQWKAELPVSPDRDYCYRPLLAGTDLLGTDPTPTFTSQVAKGSSAPFSFAVFGDWGQAYAGSVNVDQANVLGQIAKSGARFALMTGDTAYPGGSQTNYGDLQQTGTDISSVYAPQFWGVPGRSVPVYNVTGNHGFTNGANQVVNWPEQNVTRSSGGTYAMESYPSINGSTAKSYPSMWYAFDAGNARFYVLTSSWADGNIGSAPGGVYQQDYEAHLKPGTPQYEWLKNDLAMHPGGLKFAFWHYPIYADSSGQPSDTYLQGGAGTLQGLLDSNNVHIAFNGHAHGYERNVADSAGMVSYVVGNGGAALGKVSGCSAFDAYAIGSGGSHCGAAPTPSSNAEVFGFLKVSVNGQQVTVAPTSSTGRTYDVQTFTFPNSEPDSVPPTVPANVAVTNQSVGTTQVSWSASTDNGGVTGYKIYRNPGPVAGPTGDVLVGTVNGSTTSFTDNAVAPARAYTYKVSASDAAGNASDLSAGTTVTTTGPADTSAPAAPTGFTATATSSSTVNLQWTASTDDVRVVGYRIIRNGTVVKDGEDNATTFTDEAVAAATTYTYEVQAFDASGNYSTAATSTVTTPGAGQVTSLTFAPTGDTWVDQANPTATHGAETRLTVDGSPVNDSLLKFDVSGTGAGTSCPAITGARLTVTVGSGSTEASVVGGDFYGTASSSWDEGSVSWSSAPAVSGAKVASITTPVTVNTAYTVDVSPLVTGNGVVSIRHKTTSGDGAKFYSKEGSTTAAPKLQVLCGNSLVDAQAPAAPQGLATGTPTSSTVPLTWSASTNNVGVTGYEIFRDGATTATGTSTGTSFTDTGLLAGTMHTYTVKAVDAAGNRSAASAALTAETADADGVVRLRFAPTDDTWLDQANPTVAHGTATRLLVDNSPVNDGLMKFAVTGTGAGTSCPTVTGASLTVTVGSTLDNKSTRGGDFYGTDGTGWSEGTVTWNTAPAVSGAAVGSISTAVANDTAYSVSVSPLVTGNGAVTIRQKTTVSDGAGFYSKEGSSTAGPRLVVACGP